MNIVLIHSDTVELTVESQRTVKVCFSHFRCLYAMPVSSVVDLSDGESLPDLPEPPRKRPRRQRSRPTESPKENKLSSETSLKLLVAQPCPNCTSECVTAFQAPFLFHQLTLFRSNWVSTHKLDQDTIAAPLNGSDVQVSCGLT